jgi:hypothetical protein
MIDSGIQARLLIRYAITLVMSRLSTPSHVSGTTYPLPRAGLRDVSNNQLR